MASRGTDSSAEGAPVARSEMRSTTFSTICSTAIPKRGSDPLLTTKLRKERPEELMATRDSELTPKMPKTSLNEKKKFLNYLSI